MSMTLWTKADERVQAQLVQAVKSGDLLGALLAVEGAGLEQELATRAAVREWGQRVAALREGDDPTSAVDALTTVLATEMGFQGAGEDYHHPANSHISAVILQRHGLPILLTCVWWMVGEAAGIPVEGLGMPFHFIARIGGPTGIIVDPFKGGRVLTPEDCAEMIDAFSDGAMVWDPSFLTPCTLEDAVVRVLRNLMNAYTQAGDLLGLYRAINMVIALQPNQPHYRLAHGRMAEFLGQINIATRTYTDLIQSFDGTEEAQAASDRLVALAAGELEN